jgi:hypothetical protein
LKGESHLLNITQRQELLQDLYENIDFRYPLSSGSFQYDFNSGNIKTVFMGKEPVRMVYPAVKVDFHPVISQEYRGMNSVYSEVSGTIVYAQADLEPVTISVYLHQSCSGIQRGYHGKPIADDFIRRIKNRVRKYWPSILQGMEASLKPGLGYPVTDISNVQQGTERQAYEMNFYVVSTDKWDLLLDSGDTTDIVFTDAVVSGLDQAAFDAGYPYSKYHTISGLINLVT